MLDGHWINETNKQETPEIREIQVPESIKKGEIVPGNREIHAKELSESVYDQTIENITTEFRDSSPEDQLVRIREESQENKPEVLSIEEYSFRFPEADPAVLGHYDSEGRVIIKEGSPEVVTHVTTHEALHLTSFNDTSETTSGAEMYRSGIREVITDGNEVLEDNHRGLNEGITELYAIRELDNRDEEASIFAVTAYPEAQRRAAELEEVVGSDKVREAYFGGHTESLKEEVNRLNYGDETGWERYSKDIDIIEYGTDPEETAEARRRLTIQTAIMQSFKESERMAVPVMRDNK